MVQVHKHAPIMDMQRCECASHSWQWQSRGVHIATRRVHQEGLQLGTTSHEASDAAYGFAERASMDVHRGTGTSKLCSAATKRTKRESAVRIIQ